VVECLCSWSADCDMRDMVKNTSEITTSDRAENAPNSTTAIKRPLGRRERAETESLSVEIAGTLLLALVDAERVWRATGLLLKPKAGRRSRLGRGR